MGARPAGHPRGSKTIEKRDDEVKKVDDEIKVYTEEDHFKYAIPEIRELAITLHERIMELEGIESSPMKHYIGFKIPKESGSRHRDSEEAIQVTHQP